MIDVHEKISNECMVPFKHHDIFMINDSKLAKMCFWIGDENGKLY